MNRPNDYRSQLFEKYASVVQNDEHIHQKQVIVRWGQGYKYYLRNWLPQNKDASIVEAGCGNGRLLHLLDEMGYTHLNGVDISREQVEFATQLIPNAKIVQADATAWLDANPASFDMIIAIDLIEHLFKPEVLPFLEACRKALKPGGRIILQTPNADSPWGFSHRYNDFTHEVAFGYVVLTQLLTFAGFENFEAREVGPVPWGHGIKSTIRAIIWQIIRLGIIIWNLAEIGFAGFKVYTRVFLISGTKK